MLQITPQHRIWIAVTPINFRCGIDRIAAICTNELKADPFSGHLFVFRNKKGTSVKLLIYDGNGFWLCQKRFSEGKLDWWPAQSTEQVCTVKAVELLVMLQQGNPREVHVPEDWRRLPAPGQ
jgi:transposase